MQHTIVLYPAPGMGHLVSMVELGKLILHHYSNLFSITILLTTGFWDTPNITSYIHSISQTHPSITFLRFPSVSVDTSIAPTRSLAAIAIEFIRLHAPNVLRSLQEISVGGCNIRAFIIDLFSTSALSIGKQLNIPTFYFYTSGAAALSAFLQFPKVHQQTIQLGISFKDLTDTVFHFQGLNSPLKATQMPEPLLDREDRAYHDFIYFCSNLPKSNGIIVNTFEDLEPIAIKAIADGVCVHDYHKPITPPTYYIGPLIAEIGEADYQNECLSWLDKQPNRSVVFLCFGSRGSFSVAQVKEIANGLERSGQRFLWVVKSPPDDDKMKQTEYMTDFDLGDVLPDGFLERVKGRGMVVKSWAPQVAILSRESVGGFVTHCGWNSVLEAVAAGVPMVAWPLYAEQHLNRNVLVEDMKMAIAVEQREEDGFVSGTELEMRVRELMDSEKGTKLREKSLIMKEKAVAAHQGGSGSSVKAIAKLIEAWK